MNWNILGIEPTKDKKEITAAYRAKLINVNPEDSPEEFMALRAAYEEALSLAEQEEVPAEHDESPAGLWFEKMLAVYNDFQSRISQKCWEELLNDDVCIALDTRPIVEEKLIGFFMERYYIPQSIWILLDNTFSWVERREELYENYPKDFVDYVIVNGVRFAESLPYELFVPGNDAAVCDEYRLVYYEANRSNANDLPPLVDKLLAMSESHPYGEALSYLVEVSRGEKEKGLAGFKKLAEEYPNDLTLLMDWALHSADAGKWEESEKTSKRVLELAPDHWRAKRLLADCYMNTDRDEEAKDLLFELMRAAGGEQRAIYELNEVVQQINERLIGKLEDELAENPSDDKVKIKLAWAYLQNGKDDKAVKTCESIDPEFEEQYDYHHLYGKVLCAANDCENAIYHLEETDRVLDAAIAKCEADGEEITAELKKRLSRRTERFQLIGNCLMVLKRIEEARTKYEESVALAPENPDILTQTSYIYSQFGEFDRAVEVLRKVVEIMPHSYHGYYLLAQNLYELGRDNEAFENVNRALDITGSDLGVYILKTRIFIRNAVRDGAKEILDFLDANNVGEDVAVLFCKAQMEEFEQNNNAKALEMYQNIAAQIENGIFCPMATEVYFRIAVLISENKDIRNADDRAELLDLLEKGLKYNENDSECLDYKAWILKRAGDYTEALDIYKQLEKVKNHPLSVERELAELYYNNLAVDADKALNYYMYIIERNDSSELHFYSGTCNRFLGNQEAAEKEFLREMELDPNDVDAYNGLSYVYEAMGRNEEALENARKAIGLKDNYNSDWSKFYLRQIQILRRMRRVENAIKAVDELVENCGYNYGASLKFDIYCQHGRFAEAEALLENWRRNGTKDQDYYLNEIKLEIYKGNIKKADKMFWKIGMSKKLNPADYDDLKELFTELDCKWKMLKQIWREKLEIHQEKNYDLLNLAQICWWSGEKGEARNLAKEALIELEKKLKLNLVDEALYRGRYAMALALVGKEEEARAELEKVRSLPLCEQCDYCRCKDADIFEADIEEIFENYKRAMELHKAGREEWPDETDFICGIKRLEKKGFRL